MKEVVKRNGGCELMKGKILANIFYEPSTRTMCSFAAAMMRMGGQVRSALLTVRTTVPPHAARGRAISATARKVIALSSVWLLSPGPAALHATADD